MQYYNLISYLPPKIPHYTKTLSILESPCITVIQDSHQSNRCGRLYSPSPVDTYTGTSALASSPGHSQILSHSHREKSEEKSIFLHGCKIKSGSGLGTRLPQHPLPNPYLAGYPTPPCTLHHAHSAMHTPPCTLPHAPSTMPLHLAHSTMHTPPCTLHHAHSTMHTPLCNSSNNNSHQLDTITHYESTNKRYDKCSYLVCSSDNSSTAVQCG